jgi:hypothetical protein
MYQYYLVLSIYPIHQVQVRYLQQCWYQSIRPLLTKGHGGLLLGVGGGGGGFRYSTSILSQENRSGSGEGSNRYIPDLNGVANFI